MKILYMVIPLSLLCGCVSKYPLKINIDDYKKGLEITNSIVPTENIFNDNICVEFDPSISIVQQLKRQIDDEVFYTFENRKLIKKYQNNDGCHSENSIRIINIESKESWDGMFRLNLYRAEISLETTFNCNNKISQFNSTQKSKLKKHGRLISMGIIKKNDELVLVAATVVLAFDEAISDIYKQIDKQCQ